MYSSAMCLQAWKLAGLKKLDDGWPESEKGDVTAALNMMITRQQTKYFNVI